MPAVAASPGAQVLSVGWKIQRRCSKSTTAQPVPSTHNSSASTRNTRAGDARGTGWAAAGGAVMA
jgi:hypothetical protein